MSHGGIRSVLERDGHRSDAVAAAEVVSRSLSSMVTWRTQNQQDPEDAHGREVPAFCCKLSLPESSEHTKTVLQSVRKSVLLDSGSAGNLPKPCSPGLTILCLMCANRIPIDTRQLVRTVRRSKTTEAKKIKQYILGTFLDPGTMN